MAFLRKILYILFLFTQFSYSQKLIDTTDLTQQKFEYRIDNDYQDTIKWSNKRYYKSGLIKELIYLDSNSADVSIYKKELKPFEIDKDSKIIYFEMNDGELKVRNYYNKKDIIDSTVTIIGDSGSKTFVSTQSYNLFGKIKKLITWEGTYSYRYDILGRIKKMSFSSDHSRQTKYYKNGLLEKIESKNPLVKIDSIKYNNFNKPILIDRGREYLIFKYNESGKLIEKAHYWKNKGGEKDYLLEKETYKYERLRLKEIENYNRKNKKTYITFIVHKNAT